ncbi:ABC transporter permease [Psychroflexus sp. MES1-P1E]|uniref:ABC transporter permease n=1 Tax=Psychroflexus sp. MES1-P1E TaxID=2058320 RepID=UPI000C79B7BD|nr:ABC transporter permease [Psychroflexus sp. MES1-P1E]PKG43406.1 cell division protein FtsX [Psychroflexus sp. MES1-P1E]
MILNYFKIAWRNLWKHKLISTINIISLAIGFSASFVIGLMAYYDLTFDKFHPDSELIYRVTTTSISNDSESSNPGIPMPYIIETRNNMSGVEIASGIHTADFLKVENALTKTVFKSPEYVVFTDPEYFRIFSYDWLAGSPEEALTAPNEIVLTKNRAKKYFPTLSPTEIMGKTLIYNDSIQTTIKGVVANFEERTDLIFEEFLSIETSKKTDQGSYILDPQWDNTNSGSQLFIKVSGPLVTSSIRKQLNALEAEHRSDWEVKYSRSKDFELQPLSDLHFNVELGLFDFSDQPADKSVMTGLALIALFLLLLGVINFINLNTAQANQRAKEIGIRKTLGSSKKQLVFQFMGETLLLTIASALISVVLAYWLLQVFSDFTPNGLSFSLFKSPFIIGFALILIVLVTFLSGIYPALVLTQCKPISVLKNQVVSKGGKPAIRRFLTVFQFSIAQVFIISTIMVGKQIHFIMNKDMGFKTEAIANVNTPWYNNTQEKQVRFEQELKKFPEISKLARGGNTPASFSTSTTAVTYINDDGIEIQTSLQLIRGTENYIDLYGIELLAGRTTLNDTIRELIINETYLNIMGFKAPSEAIGKQIKRSDELYPIVGVVKDFNQRSLKDPIEPLALVGNWSDRSFRVMHFTMTSSGQNSVATTISKIESVFKSIYPEADFKVNFMDETVEKFYIQEKSLSKLLNWAMGLSILISCLGLLGLVIYTTNRRVKEIGVRKVLGASLLQINTLLCKEFLILVAIAFIIASPIAWYGIHNWLQDFAYKTSISFWVFLASGSAMVFFALLVISIKTLQAANANPVNSLRSE